MPDLGLTHVALTARDLDASIAFYGKYAGMAVVHRRVREGWLYRADCRPRRPFARALLWSGGRARRAVGEERMSWGALGLLYLGLKPRRGGEWRRPSLALDLGPSSISVFGA
jgi:catechol 2,3-dioxygenase-like lactoylglutathione lyase family enzyme